MDRQFLSKIVYFFAAGVLFFVGILLVGAAWLRETPSFWYEGPVEIRVLREVVLLGFYPTYSIYVALVASLSLKTIAWRHSLPSGSVRIVCLIGLSMILLTSLLMVRNNIDNLIHGRSIHYHEPYDSFPSDS